MNHNTTPGQPPTVDAETLLLVEGLIERLGVPDVEGDDDSPPVIPWRLNAIPDPMTLEVWIEYFNYTYRWVGRYEPIPSCWQYHPGLLAEIGTLYRTWRVAFYDKGATADSAQNWHDRWLPGFTIRTPQWINKRCIEGNCTETRERFSA